MAEPLLGQRQPIAGPGRETGVAGERPRVRLDRVARPVDALERWLVRRAADEGPLFTRIEQGAATELGLCDATVRAIMRLGH